MFITGIVTSFLHYAELIVKNDMFHSTHTRLELSAVLAASCPVTDDVQAPLESRTVRVLLHLGLSSPNCLTALSTRVF